MYNALYLYGGSETDRIKFARGLSDELMKRYGGREMPKVILSRKGFDSTYGGYPSPILPDGTLLSIPIPDKDSRVKYKELECSYGRYDNYARIMKDLYGSDQYCNMGAHIDPDLDQKTLERDKGWRALFGPLYPRYATHLAVKTEVSIGDIFLFFGWFRKTIETEEGLRFDQNDDKGRHVIFGYLQVGEIAVGEEARKHLKCRDAKQDNKWTDVETFLKINTWAKYHPHFPGKEKGDRKETFVLVASEELSDTKKPGAGVFKLPKDNDKESPLILTKNDETISKWRIDLPFVNEEKKELACKMSHHSQKSVKKKGYFQSKSPGQEFVIEATEDVVKWAKKIITDNIAG